MIFSPTAGFQSPGSALHDYTCDTGSEQRNKAKMSWDRNIAELVKAAQQPVGMEERDCSLSLGSVLKFGSIARFFSEGAVILSSAFRVLG